MALTIGQKCVRVLYLLRGLYNPDIGTPLSDHGFEDADLERGWVLLRRATGAKLAITRYRPPDPTFFQRLDTWENYWFPIIGATLTHNYPDVHDTIFLNLTQTDGLEVAISVGTVVERIRKAQSGTEQEQEAMALLAKRGLTDEVIGEVERILERLETKQAPRPVATSDADRAAAEEAMWAWYLEWSTIARQVIKNRRLLRSMGFLRNDGRDATADEVESDEVETDEVETDMPTTNALNRGAPPAASPAT